MLPSSAETCAVVEFDISALLKGIPFPGGLTLVPKLEVGDFPNLQTLIASLMNQLSVALVPLAPFFKILDVVIAIVDFCKAVPDSLGPPPDPTAVIAALKKLLKAFAGVLAMIPPLSLLPMLVGILRTVIAALQAVIDQIKFALDVEARLNEAAAKAEMLAGDSELAAGAAALAAAIDCARANLDAHSEGSAIGLGPISKLLLVVNTFMKLAGLPEIGSLDASGSIEPLQEMVTTLGNIVNQIPV